jgi:hypothetical protein
LPDGQQCDLKVIPVTLKRLLVAIAILVAALSVFVVSPAIAVIATWRKPAADLSAAGQNALFLQFTADSNGLATAVWMRHDGSNDIIQSSSNYPVASPTLPTLPTLRTLAATGADASRRRHITHG